MVLVVPTKLSTKKYLIKYINVLNVEFNNFRNSMKTNFCRQLFLKTISIMGFAQE